MSADLQIRLARRSTVHRALALLAISVVIVLTVVGRSLTEPAPRSALGAAGLAHPVGAVPSDAAPSRSVSPRPLATVTTHRPTHPAHPTKAATGNSAHPAPTTSRRPATRTTTASVPAIRTVTGSAYDVSYGVVQVKVTFTGSRISDITPVSLPHGGRSSDISAMAAPQLRREALAAQSASINAVSGASYTSAGYARSLQSALDRAGR